MEIHRCIRIVLGLGYCDSMEFWGKVSYKHVMTIWLRCIHVACHHIAFRPFIYVFFFLFVVTVGKFRSCCADRNELLRADKI